MTRGLCPAVRPGGMLRVALIALATMVSTTLVGCAIAPVSGESAVARLPLRLGWYEGRELRYVTTDVSDRQVAAEQGAHHVPALAAAVGPTGPRALTSRVYKVFGFPQRPVFQSAPLPVGAGNLSTAYSPLWRLVKVTWRTGAVPRELRAEEAILAAEERGEVTIEPTGVVLNCPVLEVVGTGQLPGVSTR